MLLCGEVNEWLDLFIFKYVIFVVNGDILVDLGLEYILCLIFVLLEFMIKIGREFFWMCFLICILLLVLLVV